MRLQRGRLGWDLRRAVPLAVALLSLLSGMVRAAPAVPVARAQPADSLVTPDLVWRGTREYESGGRAWTQYYLGIANWQTYSEELFAPAPDLPPCGTNAASARTWVEVRAVGGNWLNGFCGIGAPEELQRLWFSLPRGEATPAGVYVRLVDRRTGGAVTSQTLAVRERPVARPGTVVALRGTPHLWIADELGLLHWVGDTRALAAAGQRVEWDQRLEVGLDELAALARSDPWLSHGLLKDGDPIYLVKWETDWEQPRLLHVRSIRDVELFGINGANYGGLVLDRAQWERRYGIDAGRLVREPLASAVP